MARVPFARTLGFVWESNQDATARVRLPLSANAGSPSGKRIDPLAVLALLDHACSASVYLALPAPSLIATLDLRCEFAHEILAGSDVVCQAQATYLDDAFAVVRASAVDSASGQVVAYASSTYALGTHPGMTKSEVEAKSWTESQVQRVEHPSFQDLLGLQFDSPQRGWLPFQKCLVGAVSLPAVHGGASAASLVIAAIRLAAHEMPTQARWRPQSVTVNYLRAVHTAPLELRPHVRKPGRRACVVAVSSFQAEPSQEAVHGECLLVPQAAICN